MSKILLLSIIFYTIAFSVFAQEPAENVFPLKDGQIYYEKIINLDSLNKQEIFKRTKLWAVDAFRSQKNALQTEDKEEGFIIYKSSFTESFTMPPLAAIPHPKPDEWRFFCTVKFLIKDSKCKIIVYDFSMENPTIYGQDSKTSITNYRQQTDPYLKKGLMSKSNRSKFFDNVTTTYKAANATVLAFIDSFDKMIHSKENSDF